MRPLKRASLQARRAVATETSQAQPPAAQFRLNGPNDVGMIETSRSWTERPASLAAAFCSLCATPNKGRVDVGFWSTAGHAGLSRSPLREEVDGRYGGSATKIIDRPFGKQAGENMRGHDSDLSLPVSAVARQFVNAEPVSQRLDFCEQRSVRPDVLWKLERVDPLPIGEHREKPTALSHPCAVQRKC